MNKKMLIPIAVVVIFVLAVVLCLRGTPMAEVAAVDQLKSVTGHELVGIDVNSTKVVTGPDTLTGLKAGESRWRVEGTVQHMHTKTKYTVRIFIDELPDRYWRLHMIHMAQGVNVPVGSLEKIYP